MTSLSPPSQDDEGKRITCDPADTDLCSVHLHSVGTTPHSYDRIFSSPAPGSAMDIDDTIISTDPGVTFQTAQRDAHKCEPGDKGSTLVDDEDGKDNVRHPLELGKSWFLLLAQAVQKDQTKGTEPKQYFGNNGTNAENRTWIVMPEELFIVFVHVVSTPTIIPLSPLLTESVHPGDCDNIYSGRS
ncbi:hypothetical protein K443DRAFT_135701 [Laccaria amethystina LaAM-08-1]|uniref:Sortilin N-terminal domain-containing protein n=1 Tax=Laccaria amethystina LaAM-08-1 TaxID=1095629 RepID=A0A0C9WXM3_9AGAR|nr:hypothetical protein K443DRAFT_135701 [Laccaria amethystina LaAM-08-1]